MKKQVSDLAVAVAMACSTFTSFATTVDPQTPAGALPARGDSGWTLQFSDEFNGANLDTTKWGVDISTKSRAPRWEHGINDWWWTANNVEMDGTGNLLLHVEKPDGDTLNCGSVSSDGLFDLTYGYLEARIQVADVHDGAHTAFWIQSPGQNASDPSTFEGTANDGAEVDFFESAWFDDKLKTPVHADGYGVERIGNNKSWDAPGVHVGYHTYGVEWNEHTLTVYYDGVMKSQHQGIWVPQVAEFLWLSCGASFGDSDFISQPTGRLSHAKVDYVRVWQPAFESVKTLIGGGIMNGNFDSDIGEIQFPWVSGWVNLGPAANPQATRTNNSYDGSRNAQINPASASIFGLNTGYVMVEGDTFDLSYVWKDDWNWVDGTDQMKVSLFLTDDDTTSGVRTNLITVDSGLSTQNDTYELIDQNGVYTATAADAGKVIMVSIESDSAGYARLDNFELIRHSAPSNNAPVFTADPINKANATADEAYSGTINGSATDGDNDPLTYTKVSGPAWLTIATDGTLSGTPTTASADSWTVEVSDGTETDTAILNITVDPAAPSQPTTLFSDDFESGSQGAWVVSGTAQVKTAAAYNGSYGLQLRESTMIERVVSTVGYSNITLDYARRALSLSGAENLRIRWKVQGTGTWYNLETLNTTAYAAYSAVLPAAAENTTIVIRFVTNSNKRTEKAYLDDIVVTGE